MNDLGVLRVGAEQFSAWPRNYLVFDYFEKLVNSKVGNATRTQGVTRREKTEYRKKDERDSRKWKMAVAIAFKFWKQVNGTEIHMREVREKFIGAV